MPQLLIGLGASIITRDSWWQWKACCFFFQNSHSYEKKYAQRERALGLTFAVKFYSYLYGRCFTLLTDHKPLITILGPKKAIPALAAARLEHWAILLSACSYNIVYKSFSNHNNADGLSRLPLPESDSTSSIPSCFNLAQIKALPVSSTSTIQ